MDSRTKTPAKPKDYDNMSYFKIFRHGTLIEIAGTILAILLGLMGGGGISYNLVQLGEITTAFVERTVFQNHVSSRLPLLSLFGGGRRLYNATHEENMQALFDDAIAMAYGLITTLGLAMICHIICVTLISWSALRQITRIRMLFLKAVLRQDMSWYDTNSEFNFATKMTENLVKLKEGMGEKLSVVANLMGTAIICICTSFPLGWEMTLACLTVMPLTLITSYFIADYQTKSSIRELKSYSLAGKQAEEALKSIRTVVAFGGESTELERYKNLLMPAERHAKLRGIISGVGNGFNWVVTYSLTSIGLTYGTRLMLGNVKKPAEEINYVTGAVLAILFLIYIAVQCITICVPHMEGFAAARGAAASIFRLLDRVSEIDSLSEEGFCPRRVVGDIKLDNVHFSYPSRPEVKVLNGLSINIKSGESVALVGESGCGKTTVLQLLQRLYDPQSGSVHLDGMNIKSMNVGWLRSSLGIVGQEPVLFRGSIYENIAIGIPHATRDDVKAVAEMAFAHNFIIKLPNGYDTVIGERGASLSGGQKQRVAIARLLLRNPAVLLLDEPTSALDPFSEKRVQAAIEKASSNRTTIMITHRMSSIVNCPHIICMSDGVIVEEGTHGELYNNRGCYYKLVTAGKDLDVEQTETLPEVPVVEGSTDKQLPRLVMPELEPSRQPDEHHTKGLQETSAPPPSQSSGVSGGIHSYASSVEYQMQTEDHFVEEEIKPVSDWELLKLNSPEWVYLTIGAIAAIIQGACFPIFALLFGYTSAIFAMTDEDQVTKLADLYSALFMSVAVVAGIAMFLQTATLTGAGLKMVTRLRCQYFEALLRQEIGYYDRQANTVGAVCARLSGDTSELQGATGLRVGIVLQGLTAILIGVLMGAAFNWKLTLVATTFLPIMVGSIWMEGKWSKDAQQDDRNAMEAATAISTEAVVSIRTVQSLGVETVFLKKFQSALMESSAAVSRKMRWRGVVLSLGLNVPFLAFGMATVYGATLVASDEVEYKTVLLVNEAIMYGAYMLGQSLVYAPGFKSARECGARILSIINRVPAVRTEAKVHDPENWVASGSFELEDVEFSYPTRRMQTVLKGINLNVEAGKTVALVGSSGCGKSTILQLLQRFYNTDSGTIKLDNLDTRTMMSLPLLRRQLGVVQQEPVLFDRTIAENIAYGDNNRDVTMDEIISAAEAANIHSFITSLPKGYDTGLGSDGAQLSGGQKQRVCIARALVRKPMLLLLDEATSALDASSEKAVKEALETAAVGRTVLTVAHRLSTIKTADQIHVVDKGKIVESGSHAELLQKRGFYWRMSANE